jgi:putative hydrolase of the HAD superfamily
MWKRGNMEISLLADHPHEVSKIARWYFEEWASKVPNVTEEMVREDIALKASNKEIPFSIVAHKNGNLLGTLELKFRENKNYPEYEHWLGGVYVPAECRGNGIAKVLLNEAKEIAANHGVKKLYLQCESHNVGLYSGQGFKALHQSTSNHLETTIMVWCAAT